MRSPFGRPRPILLIMALLPAIACEQVDVTVVDVAQIELTPSDATVGVQGTIRLNAAVLGSGGDPLSGRALTWTSLDPNIATVAADGTVTGIAPGVATVQASSEGSTGTASVTVTTGPVIQLTPSGVEFVAIENGATPGDKVVAISNGGDGSLGGIERSVRYLDGESGWLTASLSGNTAPVTLHLSVNHGDAPAGTYRAAVDVTSTAASAPATAVVTLVVQEPQAAIGLGTTDVSFAAAQGGTNPDPRSVGITNAGGGTLNGLTAAIEYAAGQAAGWLTANLESSTAPTSLVLSAVTGSLPTGTYSASVRVRADGARNSPQTVRVTFVVGSAQPLIGVAPEQLSFSGTAGGSNPPSQTVGISNAGGGSLNGLAVSVRYPGGQPGGWLNTTLSGTSAPSSIVVQPIMGSLGAGTYSATVVIEASVAANSPLEVPVTFVVEEPQSPLAPRPPSNVSASPESTSSIRLAWSHDGDGLTDRFEIERAPASDSLNFSRIATADDADRSYLDIDLPGSSLFHYRIRACSFAGCSTYSATVKATTGSDSSVQTPSDFTGRALSETEIELRWKSPGGQTYYEIRRSFDKGSWTVTFRVDADLVKFVDTGLSKDTKYKYQIRACTPFSCSSYSSTIEVETDDDDDD